MIRTASDLIVGSHVRIDEEVVVVVDYLDTTEDKVYVEGYESDSGAEFVQWFDFDDEINIL